MTSPAQPLSVTPGDLSTFLGQTVDTDRATLLIQLATDMASAVSSPVPAAAKGLILSSVARAYANPAQVTAEAVGGFSASMPFPGLYLTKQERLTLKSLAGKGGAFSVDPAAQDGTVGQVYPWDYNAWWTANGQPMFGDNPADMGMWY